MTFFSRDRLMAALYCTLASCIVAVSWGWYHFSRRDMVQFSGKVAALTIVALAGYLIFSRIAVQIMRRTRRHPFWYTVLTPELDKLYAAGSLLFLIFFSRNELATLVYVALWLPFFFFVAGRILAKHPAAAPWLAVHRSTFLFTYSIFLLQALLQYSAYRWYILDANIKFFNIVLFRSLAMTFFWLGLWAVAMLIAWSGRSWFRSVAALAWLVFFGGALIAWAFNIGILYFSGLYLSPVSVDHAEGSRGVLLNSFTYFMTAAVILVGAAFVMVVRQGLRVHTQVPRRYSVWYSFAILLMAVLSLTGLSSIKNTPEHAIVRSFYNRYFGTVKTVTLPKELEEKLRRFGIFYNVDDFYLSYHPQVFSTTTALLADRLQENPPNIVVLFLESYSARLTGPYNERFKDVTPGLNAMAADPDTTIIRKYHNASTPTITGILSQLCSFLPPTGHDEIQNDRKLQRHKLLCLPEVLRRFGYGYTAYITAVDKTFAHKDGIFASMGVEHIFGTDELAKHIPEKPQSWGFSDHQMLPFLNRLMQTEYRTSSPFFITLSTVDTHPPFTLAQDAVPYGDGKQPVLNSFHTTDNALLSFWKTFKASPFASNTILIAVGDHAIFPGAITKDLFPNEPNLSFYDENVFLMYVPDSVLPKDVSIWSSGLDFTPTILHLLGINTPHSFEGHSLFDDRAKYPNIIGMHELGLYSNEALPNGARSITYEVPDTLRCPENLTVSSTAPITSCELLRLYQFRRDRLEQGRLWWKGFDERVPPEKR